MSVAVLLSLVVPLLSGALGVWWPRPRPLRRAGFLASAAVQLAVTLVLVGATRNGERILITPGGDPISSGTLSIVMYGLFEGTLQLMRLWSRRS